MPRREPLRATHREVLVAALRLFGERGYAGASLRELARRVGVQQPSLYHYFRSKDELVEQVLDYAGEILFVDAAPAIPERLEDVPQALAQAVLHLYDHTDWPLFVRLLFSLALSSDQFGPRLHRLFAARATAGIDLFMQPFVARGEIGAREARLLGRMVINAVGLLLIEQRIVYPRTRSRSADIDPRELADLVARVARAGLPKLRPE